MSEQIIGNYKEFLILERAKLEEIEVQAKSKLANNKERPLSEASIEARAVLSVIQWMKDNNIYNQDFKLKS